MIPCQNRWGGIRERRYKGRILRLASNKYGHRTVGIYCDQVPYTRTVHVLVAEAFLGPCPPGKEVCHGPNGKLDNRSSQLRYDSHFGNMADCLRDGTALLGGKNPQVKLTETSVADIRNRVKVGKRGVQKRLADEYSVSVATISMIVNYKIWTHLP